MKKLRYKNNPIGSVDALAAALGFRVDRLQKLADNVASFYRPNAPKIKPNGKIRQTYTVKEPLKHVQDKILHKVIYYVDFPDYLQGAIQDADIPRDYLQDAKLHSGRKVVLKEDISTFFSTISSKLVKKMWKYFFNFPPTVADILTKLTTYNGFVPEGAPTSPAVANLVFWDCEPELELSLRQKSYIYSRYIDDITVSFADQISEKEIQNITAKIYGMFLRAGLKPNRNKRDLQTKNKKIHNLNMDSGRPTMPKAKRYKIRAEVHKLETLVLTGISWDGIEMDFNSVMGKVQLLKRLHPNEGKKYLEKLAEIKEQAVRRLQGIAFSHGCATEYLK
jgi:hypothetical protein